MAAKQYVETLGGNEGENDAMPDFDTWVKTDNRLEKLPMDKLKKWGITIDELLTYTEQDMELLDFFMYIFIGSCIFYMRCI